MNWAISWATVSGWLFLAGAIAACLAWDRIRLNRWKTRFDARFPPLSAEEFLRRCRPGVNPVIALRVRQIVARQLGLPEAQIYPEQDFRRDLDVDAVL